MKLVYWKGGFRGVNTIDIMVYITVKSGMGGNIGKINKIRVYKFI